MLKTKTQMNARSTFQTHLFLNIFYIFCRYPRIKLFRYPSHFTKYSLRLLRIRVLSIFLLYNKHLRFVHSLKLLFAKCSVQLLAIVIRNSVHRWLSWNSFCYGKHFLSPVWKISFLKCSSCLTYSNLISNVEFILCTSEGFITVKFLPYNTLVSLVHVNGSHTNTAIVVYFDPKARHTTRC